MALRATHRAWPDLMSRNDELRNGRLVACIARRFAGDRASTLEAASRGGRSLPRIELKVAERQTAQVAVPTAMSSADDLRHFSPLLGDLVAGYPLWLRNWATCTPNAAGRRSRKPDEYGRFGAGTMPRWGGAAQRPLASASASSATQRGQWPGLLLHDSRRSVTRTWRNDENTEQLRARNPSGRREGWCANPGTAVSRCVGPGGAGGSSDLTARNLERALDVD